MLNKGSKEKKYKTMQEKIQMTKLNQNLSMRNFRTETITDENLWLHFN